MEALECIKTRRSIRKFTDTAVDHNTVDAIIDAARMAPSWKNTQIVRYNVIENKAILDQIANECVLDLNIIKRQSPVLHNSLLSAW